MMTSRATQEYTVGNLRYKSIGSAYSWTANEKKNMCNYGSVAFFYFAFEGNFIPKLKLPGANILGVGGFNGGVSAFRVRGLIIGGAFFRNLTVCLQIGGVSFFKPSNLLSRCSITKLLI